MRWGAGTPIIETSSTSLEEIDINESSPTKIIDEVLPRIGHRGVRIFGFDGIKHFDKDVRAILRLSQGKYAEIRETQDRENLIYTFIPLNGYGRSVDEEQALPGR